MTQKKQLIIIESPNKVAKLQKLSGIQVIATVGHFKDLSTNNLGVDLQNNYEPNFVVSSGSGKVLSNIKKLAKGREVFIATDPDREGYAIGHMVYEEIKKSASECYRVEINEITKRGVDKAFKSKVKFAESDLETYDAFLGRRVADRLVGFILSPRATGNIVVDKLPEDLKKEVQESMSSKYASFSVGRVQSAALRLVVDKEEEIDAFTPEDFWRMKIDLGKDKDFTAEYSKGRITDKDTAQALKKKVSAEKDVKVLDQETTTSEQRPFPPFTTVNFQAAASRSLGLSPMNSMRVAQSLFEKGLITYHRTDSVRVSGSFVSSARKIIGAVYGDKYLPEKPNFFSSKNSQAEAHEAIRPTFAHSLADCKKVTARERLTPQMAKVYELICKQALSSQMTPAVTETAKITFDCADEKFTAVSKKQIFDGHTKVSGKRPQAEQEFPVMKNGDILVKPSQELIQSQTKPPARYSEASLIKELENRKIGRPATFASMSQLIITKEYVSLQGRELVPAATGKVLIDYLKKDLPWVVDYDFTKKIEARLDKVSDRDDPETWRKVIHDIHGKMDFEDPSNKPDNIIPARSVEAAQDLIKRIQALDPPSHPYDDLEAEKAKHVLTDEILSSKKALGKFSYQASKFVNSFNPISAKQEAIIKTNGDEDAKALLENGDFESCRKWINAYLKDVYKTTPPSEKQQAVFDEHCKDEEVKAKIERAVGRGNFKPIKDWITKHFESSPKRSYGKKSGGYKKGGYKKKPYGRKK